ncbi:MAG: hypothetical protein GC150_00815 [Rhizobiales bacterium]|nr:hypothetical protein [Hyphomicrobiales bacterium]
MAASGTSWADLERELDHWRRAGRRASLWWRDDDAHQRNDAFIRLAALAAQHRVALMCAVVPVWLARSDGERGTVPLRPEPMVTYVQHGLAHVNHEPQGTRGAEFGGSRSEEALRDDLVAGGRLIADRLQDALAVFVPPWNRADDRLAGVLARADYIGLSMAGPRAAPEAAPGVKLANVHADIIDWRAGRVFRGEGRVLGTVVEHLAARRTGALDAEEATGIMSHHLAHDAGCWAFLERFLELTAGHEAVVWRSAQDLFGARKLGQTGSGA